MDVRSGHFRVAAATVAALVVSGVLGSSCGAAANAPASGQKSLVAYSNDFLTFRHPADWRPYAFHLTGVLHFDPMLYVSTQPATNPCRTQAGATTCGWPVQKLAAGGVLIVWENRGYPGWSLQTVPGKSVTVDGRAAKRVVSRPGRCGAIGADETVDVQIARALPSNWTEFTACLRGPNLSASEQQVDALLQSTRFHAP